MAGLKYSRQREAILQFLMTRKDHPTADAVYANIRKEFPNIKSWHCISESDTSFRSWTAPPITFRRRCRSLRC